MFREDPDFRELKDKLQKQHQRLKCKPSKHRKLKVLKAPPAIRPQAIEPSASAQM